MRILSPTCKTAIHKLRIRSEPWPTHRCKLGSIREIKFNHVRRSPRSRAGPRWTRTVDPDHGFVVRWLELRSRCLFSGNAVGPLWLGLGHRPTPYRSRDASQPCTGPTCQRHSSGECAARRRPPGNGSHRTDRIAGLDRSSAAPPNPLQRINANRLPATTTSRSPH